MTSTTPAQASGRDVVVVGIGADGWDGLGLRAQNALSGATVIYGSPRQLGLLPPLAAEIRPWRSPMSTHVRELLADLPSAGVIHILASGDPMFHGVGTTIVTALGAHRVEVIPAPSSVALACARLGWDHASTHVVSAVTADPEVVIPALTAGRRLLVLSRDATTPGRLAQILIRHGFGPSPMTVLAQLGGPAESITTATAAEWPDTVVDPLNIVAIEVIGPRRSHLPGRADTDFTHDGQITKSAIRALTVSALIPGGPRTLWDVGAGSGAIAIEWLRADAAGRAVAFEVRADRAATITANAAAHGVARRLEVRGSAPAAFDGAARPDTVFIGGGADAELLNIVWAALPAGGRLVVNTVTLENQNLLADWHRDHPGELRRFSVETAAGLGAFTTWRPALPIVQWVGDKQEER